MKTLQAVLLRRRFSTQRQANLSTSSSGTTGLNTAGSSTDSSIDASNISNIAVFSSVPSANESRRLEMFVLISSEQNWEVFVEEYNKEVTDG